MQQASEMVQLDCCICLAKLSNPQSLPCCKKQFCSQCLQQWLKLKNCCPLCIHPVPGHQPTNHLNLHNSTQFDNGSLMLQQQLNDVSQRVFHLQQTIVSKRHQSKSRKCNLSRVSMEHIQLQNEQIHINLSIASQALHLNNRELAVYHLQIVTQLVLQVEGVLYGDISVEQYESDQEQYEEEEDEYDQEDYQVKNKKGRRQPKGKLKAKAKVIQQE